MGERFFWIRFGLAFGIASIFYGLLLKDAWQAYAFAFGVFTIILVNMVEAIYKENLAKKEKVK